LAIEPTIMSDELALRRTRALAKLLDDAVTIPGTNIKLGLDFLIGMIPGIGDILGGILSSLIVLQAVEQGASKATILRMAVNILIETVVGAVPVAGDVFDAFWKSNVRNVRILEGAIVDRQRRTRADRWFVFAVISGVMLVTVGCAVGVVYLALLLKDALS
jgi:hypothetical protein